MRIASVIARYLLGLIFLVFGLNGFLHFIPMPPPKGALAAQFYESASLRGSGQADVQRADQWCLGID